MRKSIFIGSSTESKSLCQNIAADLNKEGFKVKPWFSGFPGSTITISQLEDMMGKHDFGIFILSGDDTAMLRSKPVVLPRDNVVLEAGMFVGMHGLNRTYFVCPEDVPDYRFPTDLQGVTRINYRATDSDLSCVVPHVITEIKTAISKANNEVRNVNIRAVSWGHGTSSGLTWPLKLSLMVKNTQSVAVTVESKKFQFAPEARSATNDYVLGRGMPHNVAFRRWKMAGGSDQYHEVVCLQPGEEVEAWVAFDETHTKAEMDSMKTANKCGVWAYRTIWHDPAPKAYNHELEL